MEKKKGTGKRGRPRKNPPKPVETGPKRKRGRPPKAKKIPGSENIVTTPIIEETYIEPKILRKKRVFRFDKNIFHALAHKFNGDIIKMSYVVNELMNLYISKKIKVDPKSYKIDYYSEWVKGNPPLEPITPNEIAQSSAVIRGIPLQYKYSLIIDESTFALFEKVCQCYYPFMINKLVQMYLEEKNRTFMDKHIKPDKSEGWCNI